MTDARALLYEGKAKKVYTTDDPDLLVVEFKDSLTAFDGLKKATMAKKGELNCAITSRFFEVLADHGLPTHFVRTLSPTRLLARRLAMVMVETVVRNYAAGHVLERLGGETGRRFKRPIVEFNYKNDALHDPLVNADHIFELGLASEDELATMRALALRTNDVLGEFLAARSVRLVDFKLEFGRADGKLLIGDEVTPDSCRFWDMGTGTILDKDRFRKDQGNVLEAYEEILRRIR